MPLSDEEKKDRKREARKRYRAKNREKILAEKKRYRERHRDEIREKRRERGYDRTYRECHREKINAKKREVKRKAREVYLETHAEEIALKEKAVAEKKLLKAVENDWRKMNRCIRRAEAKIRRSKRAAVERVLHLERVSARYKKCYRQQSDNLTDAYVVKQLTKRSLLCAADVPQELIEAKRQHLRLRRELKELNK